MSQTARTMKRAKRSIYELMWLGVPIIIWFSYYPNISFGQTETMNLEVSLPLLYLSVLTVIGLPSVWAKRKVLIHNRAVQLVSLFVIYSVFSILWSVNPLRGVLTGTVTGMLYLLFLGAVANKDTFRELTPLLVRTLLVSSLVMSFMAIVQFFVGIWQPQDATLLCNGCVSMQFGFPRPNVFAIEPQFFASLLLPGLLIAVSRLLRGKNLVHYVGILTILTVTLLLTMSRGAIFAFGLGALILVIYYRHQLKQIFWLFGLMMLSGATALSLQGLAASLSPSVSETFGGAVTKSLSQLSLGVLTFKPQTEPVAPTPKEGADKVQPVFDGYVEESTDIRVNNSALALSAWSKDARTIVIGAGIGGAGVAMSAANSHGAIGAREIVQNEYIEVLLERGIIGLIMWLALLLSLMYTYRKSLVAVAVIAAFMFQWLFFSGLPNALHIYIALMLIAIQPVVSKNKL